MKNSLIALIVAFLLNLPNGFAQDLLKIGHVNIPEIVQQMPETDSIKTIIEKETEDMEKMYGEMISEHEAGIKDYEEKKDTYSEFVRTEKEKSLMGK